MRFTLPVTIVAVLVCAGCAFADGWFIDQKVDVPKFQKGDTSISLGGAYLAEDGAVEEAWNMFAEYGKFINPTTEVALRWWGDEDIQNAVVLGAYHFGHPLSTVFPYVTAGVGYRFVDTLSERARGADDDFLWQVGVGAKYFINPSTGLFAEYIYSKSDGVQDDAIVLGLNKIMR
jgi:hypothetical protein